MDTQKICMTCQIATENDDPGACFGSGFLCPKCGYYRSFNPKALSKKKTQKLPTPDLGDQASSTSG